MSYIDPKHVDSPKISVSALVPVYDAGEGKYAVALLKWDGEDRVAMRWNGETKDPNQKPPPGNPQSRGLPTWFVIPPIFDTVILQALLDKGLIGGGSIDKKNAEDAIRDAITLRGDNGEALGQTDKLEEKMITIIEKLKSEGKI
jgi:hypothetical protein